MLIPQEALSLCIKYVQSRLRHTRSTGWGNILFCISQPVLHTLSLHSVCASACMAHPQPVQHTLSLYSSPSARTAHQLPVQHTHSPYGTPFACTAHPSSVLHIRYTGWLLELLTGVHHPDIKIEQFRGKVIAENRYSSRVLTKMSVWPHRFTQNNDRNRKVGPRKDPLPYIALSLDGKMLDIQLNSCWVYTNEYWLCATLKGNSQTRLPWVLSTEFEIILRSWLCICLVWKLQPIV